MLHSQDKQCLWQKQPGHLKQQQHQRRKRKGAGHVSGHCEMVTIMLSDYEAKLRVFALANDSSFARTC
jgi:hypothetical protein